jgi:hypothetical protein
MTLGCVSISLQAFEWLLKERRMLLLLVVVVQSLLDYRLFHHFQAWQLRHHGHNRSKRQARRKESPSAAVSYGTVDGNGGKE